MNTLVQEIASSAQAVLVVDDEPGMRAALEVGFRRRGWQVATASGKNEALARLHQRRHALVVTDIRMPDGNGFEVMRAARAQSGRTAVILLTAFASVPDAVEAMKSGACEYLVKPASLEQLLATAEKVAGPASLTASAGQMVGSSPTLMRALARAHQAAQSDADILIEAESGTGKELLARQLHALSARSRGPFVAINCAGIPESLLESELFGHARGAFTGAERRQAGKFEAADGGTLVLDEISEMPLSLQPKLLRALQEREFYRLGETRALKVDLRVIATTNRPLAAMVREGSFRADLYYRLNVVPLTLPPLRERPEDIRALALHFARQFSPAQPLQLPESFFSQLESYPWPGNVRELANVIHRAVALGGLAMEIEAFSPEHHVPLAATAAGRRSSVAGESSLPKSLASRVTAGAPQAGMSLQLMEKRLLEMTLEATGGNRSRAAGMLGISLRTVRNKIREYNLPPRSEYVHAIHD